STELLRMRDSHREQVPDRSILVAGHGAGLWRPALGRCGVWRRCGLRLAAAISGPEGFESGLAVSDGCDVPCPGVGPAACEFGTGPVAASAAHPCGWRSMHAPCDADEVIEQS